MLSPEATVGLEWMFCALALGVLATRLCMRLQVRQWWASDALLCVAAACLVGTAASDTATYQMGAMSNYTMVNEPLGKIRLAEKYLFDVGLYLPKMSLVMSYETIVPPTHRAMRAALLAIAIFVAAGALLAGLADTFWCGWDVSVNWSMARAPGETCTSFTNPHLQKVTWSMNITAELLFFMFPIPILRSLRVTELREQVGLVLIFSLGAITIIVSTVRFVYMSVLTNDISLYVLTTAELSISIMVVSLMAMRPLLNRMSRAMVSAYSAMSRSPWRRAHATSQAMTDVADTNPTSFRSVATTVLSDYNVDVEAMNITLQQPRPGNLPRCHVAGGPDVVRTSDPSAWLPILAVTRRRPDLQDEEDDDRNR